MSSHPGSPGVLRDCRITGYVVLLKKEWKPELEAEAAGNSDEPFDDNIPF